MKIDQTKAHAMTLHVMSMHVWCSDFFRSHLMIVFLLREKTSHRIIDQRKQLHGLKGKTDFCGFVHFLFTVPDEINGLCLSGVETRVVVPGRF